MGTAFPSRQHQPAGPLAGERCGAGPAPGAASGSCPIRLIPAPPCSALGCRLPSSPLPHGGDGTETCRLGYIPWCENPTQRSQRLLSSSSAVPSGKAGTGQRGAIHTPHVPALVLAPSLRAGGSQGSLPAAPAAPTPPAFLQLLNGFCDTVLHFLVPDRADQQGVFWGLILMLFGTV